jgi:hypothetical protein
MSPSLDTLTATVNRLADRAAIIDLFSQFAAAMDVQDWDLLADVFSDDAIVDHSMETWDGEVEELWVGIDEVMAKMRDGISRHASGHHMITNHRVTIDGDHARAVAYLHSVHLDDAQHPEVHGDHGGWYLCDLVRAGAGWKVARMKHVYLWRDGTMAPTGPTTDAQMKEMMTYLR